MNELYERFRFWLWRRRIHHASARLDRINRDIRALREEQHAAANYLHSLMRDFKAEK